MKHRRRKIRISPTTDSDINTGRSRILYSFREYVEKRKTVLEDQRKGLEESHVRDLLAQALGDDPLVMFKEPDNDLPLLRQLLADLDDGKFDDHFKMFPDFHFCPRTEAARKAYGIREVIIDLLEIVSIDRADHPMAKDLKQAAEYLKKLR